jgi:4-amino-4-deoxy-L-arabinose transferase-like glycosyltransferase
MKDKKGSGLEINDRSLERIFVLFLIVIGLIYLLLSSQTKMLEEDEPLYVELGAKFSQFMYPGFDGVGRAVNIQPFVPLVFALPFIVFGPSLALAKMIIAVFGILTLLVVYLIGKKISIYWGLFSAFLLLSAGLFAYFMMIVYVEVPIAFFSALATYMILGTNSSKRAVLAGVAVSLAFLTKQTGLFLIAGFLIYMMILYIQQRNKRILKLMIIVILVAGALSASFILRNILLYNYPYIHFLNLLFSLPPNEFHGWPGITTEILSTPMFTLQSYVFNTSVIMMLLFVCCIILFFAEAMRKKIDRNILLFVVLTFMFISLYYIYYFMHLGMTEARNLFIIFPQMALIGGYLIYRIQDYKNFGILMVVAVIMISSYLGLNAAFRTVAAERYPADYLQALSWIKSNSAPDDVIMTTYGGSVKYFADRDNRWTIDELPDIMSANNTTYIYKTLKDYNISYVLVWKSVLDQKFVIPESNLMGIFTYKFFNMVMNDTEHFNITYRNENNVVFKLV